MKENTDIFKQLNNHSLPTDESYWAEMEQRLQSVPVAARQWQWFAGAGAAAFVTVLLAVWLFNAGNETVGTRITQMIQISADNNVAREAMAETSTVSILTDNKITNPRKSALQAPSAFKETEGTAVSIVPIEKNTIIPEKQAELKPVLSDVKTVDSLSNPSLEFGKMPGVANEVAPSPVVSEGEPHFSDVLPSYPNPTVHQETAAGETFATGQCPEIEIPQYFTPNADGQNDFWKIGNIACYQYKIILYDRYGNELFVWENNFPESGWDGTRLGKPLYPTDYWYRIVLNAQREYTGHFSLLR